MYDTLIMLKPNSTFSVDALHQLVQEVLQSSPAAVEHDGNWIKIILGKGRIFIYSSSEPHVIEESNEIAERFRVPSHGCLARFEMNGEDPEMELFNDYLLINERLQKAGNFVIFDTQECKLLFDDA